MVDVEAQPAAAGGALVILLPERSNRALQREGSVATSEPEAAGRGGERCRGATFTAGSRKRPSAPGAEDSRSRAGERERRPTRDSMGLFPN